MYVFWVLIWVTYTYVKYLEVITTFSIVKGCLNNNNLNSRNETQSASKDVSKKSLITNTNEVAEKNNVSRSLLPDSNPLQETPPLTNNTEPNPDNNKAGIEF